MNMQIRPVLGQHLAMTPQLLQSIRLLQLSKLDLELELQQALETNVLLEDAAEDTEDADTPAHNDEPAAAEQDATAEVSGQAVDAHAQLETGFDWSSAEGWSGGEPVDDDGESWEARTPARGTHDVRIAALEQLQLIIGSAREARLIEVMLDAVDDNGYLTQPLDGIAMESALQPLPGQDELDAALALLQSVEPTGFGARSLGECLMLQLRAMPAGEPGRALAERLVSTELDAIAAGELDAIAERHDADDEALRQAVDLILSLNPRPGAALAAPAEAVAPDVIVSGRAGMWKVELCNQRLPRLRVNPQYERALTRASGHKHLRDQLQEARWLVRGLEMRHDTLLRTTRAIFERQAAFLEHGEEGMVPLTLREIADAIGMHESTICRVTTQKWVQTPWGVYELKAFFPSQISGRSASEKDVSGTAVKAMIRRILDDERSDAPLCDGDITALLARRGVHVARRTVAKYREAMKIAPAKQRACSPRGLRQMIRK